MPSDRAQDRAPGTPEVEVLAALAEAVVAANADAPSSWMPVEEALVCAASDPTIPPGARQRLVDALLILREAVSSGPAVVNEALGGLGKLVSELQLESRQNAPVEAARSLVRDQDTIGLFGDFLQESMDGLTQAEEALLAIDASGPDPEKTKVLYRVFHTIKGVAGFLELEEVISLGRETESLIRPARDGEKALEGALLEAVFAATAAMRRLLGQVRAAVEGSLEIRPDPTVAPLVGWIQAIAGGVFAPDSPAVPAAAPPVEPQPVERKEPPSPSVVRNQDTIDLIGDFLEEATDGLARADATLLAIEESGSDPEKTNALFRVFHTIKGVAGFLELTEIISVAHETESLLDQVREGEKALGGAVLRWSSPPPRPCASSSETCARRWRPAPRCGATRPCHRWLIGSGQCPRAPPLPRPHPRPHRRSPLASHRSNHRSRKLRGRPERSRTRSRGRRAPRSPPG